MTIPRLQLTNLGLKFGLRQVLQDINLTLAPGEIIGLVGPAGSGKSVLLKTIAGLLDNYSGTCTINYAPGQTPVGMSFQNNALFDFLTVAENVAFPLNNSTLDHTLRQNMVSAILQEVGLEKSSALAPSDLSGGMQRRVGVARALIAQPALVLFDDPTAGLDPVTGARIFSLIKKLIGKQQAAAIIVSSDVQNLCSWVERLLIINFGKLVYDGPAATAAQADNKFVRQFITGREDA